MAKKVLWNRPQAFFNTFPFNIQVEGFKLIMSYYHSTAKRSHWYTLWITFRPTCALEYAWHRPNSFHASELFALVVRAPSVPGTKNPNIDTINQCDQMME